MRISWKSVSVLVFVVLISGSILLYPVSAKSLGHPIGIIIIKDLPVEPHPIFGEPGSVPDGAFLLSSSYVEVPVPDVIIIEDEDVEIQADKSRNRVIRFIYSKLLKLTGKTF